MPKMLLNATRTIKIGVADLYGLPEKQLMPKRKKQF